MRSTTVKRATDVIGAVVGLLLGALPMAVVAVAIRVTMGSPVIFRQVRPGLRGEPFTMFKFRTMRVGDEPDPERVTRLGRFLRATSLDELPELWNVLRGDMSLVGPRPLLVEYLSQYSPEQARRHEVRPGLTGPAQVEADRLSGWEEHLAADVRYVDTWTNVGDLRILARTPAGVLRRTKGPTAVDTATTKFTGTPSLDR